MHTLKSISITKQQFINLINSTTTLNSLKQIHTQLLIHSHLQNPNFLAQFVYSIATKTPKNLNYCNHLVNQCKTPNVFLLNTMIRAYSKSSTPKKSFYFFNKLLSSRPGNVFPDNYTFNFLIRACVQELETGFGPVIHGSVIKCGFDFDPHVQSGLILMYSELGHLNLCREVFDLIPEPDFVCQTVMVCAFAKCGDVVFARKVFDLMPDRDNVAWSAMISGYAQCGESREALRLFGLMQLEGVKINEVTLVSVLSACSQLGAFDYGRWVHAYIERYKIPVTVTLGTSLVDMYAKCGNMEKAMEVFWSMKEKNVYTWSSAINGLAMNGDAHECLKLFLLMKYDGVWPNDVTFVSVLRACSVVGLVEEGCKHFDSMRQEYGIQPTALHYGCMVDLYGRSGRLEEAFDVINSMPIKPHSVAWGALLNACNLHKHMELAELASKKIIELEGKNHAAYVLLSNIYADSKNWDDVDNVRQVMKTNGVKKQPGCSVIEVNGEVHEFFVGDNSHLCYNEIVSVLGEISRKLKLSDHVANAILLPLDIA